MKVYYKSSLWYTGENRGKKEAECRCKQKINWAFEHLGQKCYVPYIYRFKKGIVFDIITPVADEVFQAYIEKYNAIDLQDKHQRRQLEEERPYQTVDIAEIWINGESGDRYSSSAKFYSPLENIDENYKKLKKAYREILKDEIHFFIERVCVPYPNIATGFQKLKRPKRGDVIYSLKIESHEVDRDYPLEKKFKLSATQPTYEMEIIHPVSKEKYRLSFEIGEQQCFKVEENQLHTTVASYEINPPIKNGDRLYFDNSLDYRSKSQCKYEPEGARSIGIIGGADGPTAFFMTSKVKKRSCFSKITFEFQEEAEFELKSMYITVVPRQTYEYHKKVYNINIM